jgi:hypothetical protein
MRDNAIAILAEEGHLSVPSRPRSAANRGRKRLADPFPSPYSGDRWIRYSNEDLTAAGFLSCLRNPMGEPLHVGSMYSAGVPAQERSNLQFGILKSITSVT